ncbi:MAG: PQQ-dependent sugar dehydrogenase [Rhodospirillaceae bacterium]|nr:PQQ-dependent sugar dehydrogenase [Rhodospirillaceae bacterium]
MCRLILAFVLLVGAPIQALAYVEQSKLHDFRVVQITGGLEHPWSLAFLPDRSILITERPGRLRVMRNGKLDPKPITGLPEIANPGQGGLLDVVPHPDFARNRWLYLSYVAGGEHGHATHIARARLSGSSLKELQVLLVAEPFGYGGRHFGSRLAFAPDGSLFVTSGERGNKQRAQKLNDLGGKVLRLRDDGAVPPDNPFVRRPEVRPEIFSFGHRNPQGMAVHPETGHIGIHEHGPRGGDEINLVQAGLNYGWPVITHGIGYDGSPIGIGKRKSGLVQPLWYWVPSIAPSGMAFYDGDRFPKWRGSLFVGALAGRLLVRLTLDGSRVTGEERLLKGVLGRVRDVRQGRDGLIYVLTDSNDGGLYRLEPVP